MGFFLELHLFLKDPFSKLANRVTTNKKVPSSHERASHNERAGGMLWLSSPTCN